MIGIIFKAPSCVGMESAVGTASAQLAGATQNRARVAKPSAGNPKEIVVFIVHSYAPISRHVQLEKAMHAD